MCRQTDMPACEKAVNEIEQQLENEHDLDFRGLLSDKAIYIRGHWIPWVHANGVNDEEQALVELARNAMLLHSTLELEWLLSTTAIDEGANRCSDRLTVEKPTPALKPLILCLPRPVESQGRRMSVTPVSRRPVTRERAIEGDGAEVEEMDVDMSISLACRDGRPDHSVENVLEDKIDADASVTSSREDNEHHCLSPEADKDMESGKRELGASANREGTNADTFINSTCRDTESDCSIGVHVECCEMDVDTSIETNVLIEADA